MSWWRRSRPVYAVEGVEPVRSDGWDVYAGESLAGRPAVAAAVARLPAEPVLADLPGYLAVATRDGREWALSLEDGMLIVFDLSRPGTDTFEQVLAAAPWTTTVERVDREAFLLGTGESLPADLILAGCVDACGTAYRRLHLI
ncbi:hypothetical protein [Actinoplanes sp. NPDC051851]|uniref:hypothetical protein n=1 Tax=Actinoplanes sp. NPDC051851 TaxID=3154753 RepID=UPI00341A692A